LGGAGQAALPMTISADYRRFMEACLHWADHAASQEERNSFLQMAKTWYEAALAIEQSTGLVSESEDLLERLRKSANRTTP
jgi:hypothetical protein